MLRMSRMRRAGATTVETAIVLTVFMLLIVGILVCGIGVFRYQQVAWLSREASRWASTRGAEIEKESDRTCPTQQEIRDAAIMPYTIGMEPDQLAVDVEFVDAATDTAVPWNEGSKEIRSISTSGEYVTNRVRVTVTYRWLPGRLGRPMTLRSVSEHPLTN